jgi:hypothetical protein
VTGHEAVAIWILTSTGLAAGVGDYIYTVKGLALGAVETNPVVGWLQKKVGTALAAFIGLAFFVGVQAVFSTVYPIAAVGIGAGITGLEVYNTIHGYLTVKKMSAAKVK